MIHDGDRTLTLKINICKCCFLLFIRVFLLNQKSRSVSLLKHYLADEVAAKMRPNCCVGRRVLIDLGEEIVLLFLPCESPTLLSVLRV